MNRANLCASNDYNKAMIFGFILVLPHKGLTHRS
jgi:hypothetical protein